MRTKKQGKQQGFILALALLMMLFVGLVVITSTERTGQETRISQSDAPIATLQAAAEAGLLTLRQKINGAGQKPNGICKDHTENAEDFCECVEKKVNDSGLEELMGAEGYSNSETPFSSKEGLPDVYWWFTMNTEEDFKIIPIMETDGVIHCRFKAQVYAGDPASNPGHFMAGTIDIKTSESAADKIKDLLGLGENKKFEDLTADDIKDIFYEEDENGNLVLKDAVNITGYDPNFFTLNQLESGGVLDPASLDATKVNFIVLEGGATIPANIDGKKVILISKSQGTIDFSNSGGSGNAGNSGNASGGGNQSDGISGWIIAPDGVVDGGHGRPEINMNVVASDCNGNSSFNGKHDPCFHQGGGGSSFNSNYDLDNFNDLDPGQSNENDPDSTGSGNVTVDSSEEMDMDFDY